MPILSAMIFSSYFLSHFVKEKTIKIGSVDIKRRSTIAVIIVFLIITVIAGYRLQFVDSGVYRAWYANMDPDWSIVTQKKDPGFYVFAMLLHNISTQPQAILIATSALIYALVLITVYRYSMRFELSVFIFLTDGLFFLSINGIRQFIAAAILFAAFNLLAEGKFLKYALVVLLATTFHASAIIMLPVYFIVRGKAWSFKTLVFFIITAVAYLQFDKLFPLVEGMVEGTQYEANLNYFKMTGVGSNIIRVVVSAIPLVIAFFERKRLKELWDKSDIIVNLSLLNVVIMLFATYNFIIARLAFYFQIYDILLFPLIICACRKELLRTTVYLGSIILYFFYFYYELNYMFQIDYRLIFSFI